MDEYIDTGKVKLQDMKDKTEGEKRKCVCVTEWVRLGEIEMVGVGGSWAGMR